MTVFDTTAAPTMRRIVVANIHAEWTKLRSVRSTTWTLLATIGITVGFGALVAASQLSNWDNLSTSERLRFDPTFFSLGGLWLAQLAVGVLGVLVVTSEFATGQIRATFCATPRRATALAAKAASFSAVVLAVGAIASFIAFFVGQAILASKGLGVPINEAGVLRAVFGGALYLAAVGLLGIGLGTILRRTAGAVATLVGVLVLAPLVGGLLPASFQESIGKYFPAQAGMSVFSAVPDPRALSPWRGYLVLLAYVAITLLIGARLLIRRDA